MVFGQTQQNRIVDDAALGRRQEDILALAHRTIREIARRQKLGEAGGVGSGNLDLTFNRHVTQDRVVHQVPEVLHRVAKIARNVHVIVDGITRRTPPLRRLEIGRLPHLRAEPDLSDLINLRHLSNS